MFSMVETLALRAHHLEDWRPTRTFVLAQQVNGTELMHNYASEMSAAVLARLIVSLNDFGANVSK